jgi:putative hydrolase of HD superfamily
LGIAQDGKGMVIDMTDFEKQINFIMEMDKIKHIGRQTYLADASRKENDAEHSWHLALMAFVLADYANESVDVLKTMKMVLLHDVIEIDAGDTYAYDVEGNKSKREREVKAADRIFGLLPEAQQAEYRGLWDEFEAMETPEAKFANMLDKVQPLLLNDASGGKSWEEHGVKKSQVLARNSRTHEGSEQIWAYARELIEKNAGDGRLLDE